MGADINTRILKSSDKESAKKEYLENPIYGTYLIDEPINYCINKIIFHDDILYDNIEIAENKTINMCKKWDLEGHAVKFKENNEIKWIVFAITPS